MRRSARLSGIKIEQPASPPNKKARKLAKVEVKYEHDDDISKETRENDKIAVKQELTDLETTNVPRDDESKPINKTLQFPDVSKYKQGNGPPHWPEILTHVRNTRLRTIAVVDTMGCERLQDSNVESKVHRYQLLIALMLSSQTRDETNAHVMSILRSRPGGLNVDTILDTDEATLDKLIFKVGFHSRKAKYIKQTTQILRDQYDDDVPPTIEEMCKLPGVGPKMAHLLMHRAWNKVDGIGVDVHVHRLAQLWKWNTKKQNSTPEDTRKALEDWLPRELWMEINPLLVGFGQAVCQPRGSKCGMCDLSGTGLCPGDKAKRK